MIKGISKRAPTAPKKTKPLALGEFDLTNVFRGYRNKEDLTNLEPGFLVAGSKNVLNKTDGTVSARPGYALYGQAGTATTGVLGSYDWNRHTGDQRNVRSANGKIQFAYVATAGDVYKTNTLTAGQVYWIDLLTGLSSSYTEYTTFWDNTTEKIDLLLFVNRSSFIYEWSGGVATILSTTVNSITKTGTTTWAQSGFLTAGTRQVLINGNTYTYTGGETTTTLTGVTGDPTVEANQSVVVQATRSWANTGGLPATFSNDRISSLNNQIYVGSLADNNVYVSKIDNYKDYAYTSPTRKPGEGARLTLDGVCSGFAARDQVMDISAGKDFWFETKFTLSSDLVSEALSVTKLKTSPLQGALSQGLIENVQNDVAFLSNEPVISTLGWVASVIQTPQISNISDPIKNDIDTYGVSGFADGHMKYYKYFLYVSVPSQGIVLAYNFAKGWWEAPWNLPVGRFSVIGGELIGHSYLTDESYTLLTGANDNGNPIDAAAAFSYQNFGSRAELKKFTEFYIEGYISSNTELDLTTKLDFGGFTSSPTYKVLGSDSSILFQTITDGSLGKNPLGSQPLGSITDSISNTPKFRVIETGIPQDFFEMQIFFESNQIDGQWSILSFGPKIERGADATAIKQ